MKEIVVTTTRPATGALEYGVREAGHWLHESLTCQRSLASLTQPQRDVLTEAGIVLLLLAEEHAGTLPPGRSVRVEISKPATNQVEYSLLEGGALLRHGVLFAYDLEELPPDDAARLVAARELLLELATDDATARGLA